MNQPVDKPPNCPTELLPKLLDDSLDQQQADLIEEHLDGCARCRDSLKTASGGDAFWTTIGDLSDDDLDRDWADEQSAVINQAEESERKCRQQQLRTAFESVRPLLAPTDDPQSVGRIGNYEVTGLVGSGGMGVVVKATDAALDRVVAIKLLAPHLSAYESSRLRFQREAKAAAAVQHDGIIPIYSVDTHNGVPYFVMPYEVGPSLQQRVESEGQLSVEESLRVASQIANALAAAHQSGLVHRDIKPSNILLAPGTERALLTDFGLAQAGDQQAITQTGLLAGTPMFMSPEQARGESVDNRSDLFSLASVMFVMLTGRPPVEGDSSYSVVRKIGGEPMPTLSDVDASLPKWLSRIVHRLHASKPEDRLQTAAEVADVLNQCLAHVQNPAECELPARFASPPFMSSQRRNATAATLLAVAIGGVTIFGWANQWWADSTAPLDAPNAVSRGTSDTDPTEQASTESPSLDTQWNDGLDDTIEEIEKRLNEIVRDVESELNAGRDQ